MKGFEGIGFEVAPSRLMRTGQIVTGDILSDENISSSLARNVLLLRTLLKPGGRLYLTLPDSSSWVAGVTGQKWNMLLLEHLWYFNPDTLRRFCARCGLIVKAGGPFLTWSISLPSFCEPDRHMVIRFRPPPQYSVSSS